jgi:glycosyltransferase involved in cell wall biosynthesis
MSTIAFIPVFNEADILPWTLMHLAQQGVDVYILDNWSTDESLEIVRQNRNLVGFESFPRFRTAGGCELYQWRATLERIEQLSKEAGCGYRWCMLHDADEIRRSPVPDETLNDMFTRVAEEGYNQVGFKCITFRAIDDTWDVAQEHASPEEAFRMYDPTVLDARLPHIKAWRAGQVELSSSGGHHAHVWHAQVYPTPAILKHYPIRSTSHGRRKVLRERLPRYMADERAQKWHVQYDRIAAGQNWLADPATLLEYKGL